jgi:hypothetical protein
MMRMIETSRAAAGGIPAKVMTDSASTAGSAQVMSVAVDGTGFPVI